MTAQAEPTAPFSGAVILRDARDDDMEGVQAI